MKNGERIDILFKLKINEWNDTRTPQLIIEDVRKSTLIKIKYFINIIFGHLK